MLTDALKKHRHWALLLIVALGLSLRLSGLGSVGFNEDEIQKVRAGRAYLQGRFSINLEHPMLMKSLIAISLAAGDAWNREAGQFLPVPEEASVRLPNAIFGSLMAAVLFLLARELFGPGVGLLSAVLWATGTIAITVNRVAKEDTLLAFFTWLAYYLYLRAKTVSTTDSKQATRFYGASGVSFGLMLASKYFPHYFGLNTLYYFLFDRGKPGRPLGKRAIILLLASCAATFVVANPVILLPSTLNHFVQYIHGSSITHHGYLVMGQMYREDVVGTGGMPAYFYLMMLVLKTPVPILAGLLVGLVETWRRRGEHGFTYLIFMFVFWIVPFSLIGPKWLRYMLAWMPTVYIIAAIGLVRIWSWLTTVASRSMSGWFKPALAAAFMLVFIVYPIVAAANISPHYSLYVNAFGRDHNGVYFPHDEVNDMGLQGAALYIAQEAPYMASVGGEAEAVFQYYFPEYGRDDFEAFSLSPIPHKPGTHRVRPSLCSKTDERMLKIVRLSKVLSPVNSRFGR